MYRTPDRTAQLEDQIDQLNREIADERAKIKGTEGLIKELRLQAWPTHKRILSTLQASWRTTASVVGGALGIVGLVSFTLGGIKYCETHPEPTHTVVDADEDGLVIFRVTCHSKPGDWCYEEPDKTCSDVGHWSKVNYSEREWTEMVCTSYNKDAVCTAWMPVDHWEGTMLYRCVSGGAKL